MAVDDLSVRLTARDELTGKLKATSAAVKQATSDLADLNKKLDTDAGKKAYDEARRSLSELSLQEKRLRAEMGRNERAIKQLSAQHEKSTNAMGRAIDRVRGKWDSMSDRAQTWTKRAAGGVVAAGAAATAASVNLAGKFEQSQNVLQASARATNTEMQNLQQLAMDMGAKTSYSAQDASDAMIDLSKAGLKVNEIMGGGVQSAMSLAATEGIEMSTAANTAANAMSMFKLKAKDLPAVADALAGGSNASTASVSSLALGLSQVGPGAYNAGLSLNDTIGVLASFEQAGIKGSDAGTSLKTMLTRLVPATDKAYEAMVDLGIVSFNSKKSLQVLTDLGIKPASGSYLDVEAAVRKYVSAMQDIDPKSRAATKGVRALMTQTGMMDSQFIDAKGNFEDITTIAGVLQKQLGGLTQEEKTKAMATLFGSDATRAASILTREGAKGLEKYIRATQEKGGAERMAAARTKGFRGQMEAFRGSVETLGIEVGMKLIPKLTQFAKWGTDSGIPMARRFGAWLDRNKGTILAVTGVLVGLVVAVKTVEGATRVWSAATKTWTGVTKLAHGAQTLWNGAVAGAKMAKHAADIGRAAAAAKLHAFWTKAAGLATKVWGRMTQLAAGAQRALSAAMAANPVALVIIAIVALIAILVVCYKRFTWFRNIVDAVWRWIKRVVASFVNWFAESAWPVIKKVIGFIVGYYKFLWNVAKALWTGTIRVVKAFINWFSDSAWPTIKRVGAAIGKSWELVKEGAKVAWNAIKSAVLKPIELIQKAVEKLKSWLGGLFDGVASAAKTAADAVRGAWDGLTSWLPGRFMGGPVVAGSPYMVGELGPELFASRSGGLRLIGADGPEVRTFSEPGTVIPHHLVPSVTAVHRERVEHREVREGPLVTIGAINATGSLQDVEAAVKRAIAHADRLRRERR